MINSAVGPNVLTICVSFSVNDAIPHNVISDTYVINHVDSFLLHIPASGQEAARHGEMGLRKHSEYPQNQGENH